MVQQEYWQKFIETAEKYGLTVTQEIQGTDINAKLIVSISGKMYGNNITGGFSIGFGDEYIRDKSIYVNGKLFIYPTQFIRDLHPFIAYINKVMSSLKPKKRPTKKMKDRMFDLCAKHGFTISDSETKDGHYISYYTNAVGVFKLYSVTVTHKYRPRSISTHRNTYGMIVRRGEWEHKWTSGSIKEIYNDVKEFFTAKEPYEIVVLRSNISRMEVDNDKGHYDRRIASANQSIDEIYDDKEIFLEWFGSNK